MVRQITSRTTVENLKKEAKRWLAAIRANSEEARARLHRASPLASDPPALRDVQHALALEHGLPGWIALTDLVSRDAVLRRYERVADALVTAYRSGERSAMRIVWDYFGHMRSHDAMRRYVRLDLGKTEEAPAGEEDELTLAEARFLVARVQGFESWDALAKLAAAAPRKKETLAIKPVAAYSGDDPQPNRVEIRSRDWDEVLDSMRLRRIEGLHANGQMTDALLESVSRIEHITSLDLSGSSALTDDGVRHLGRLPRLRHLNLSGTAITDRGLEVLRRLRALQRIALAWTRVTDAGMVHLAACAHLRFVDLTGTETGEGAIRALAGKNELHELRSGNAVTNAGLALLHELPVFKQWHGGEVRMALLDFRAAPNYLMLRGSFDDEGLAHLAGLDGLFALNLDSDRLAVTGAGLEPLAGLPHLEWLAFDAKDESMPYIAALPRLRFLMCQDTMAGDDGFVALGRSRTIEYLWGRRCTNLRRRGFMALAAMPALRSLSVSCRNVDDAGLAALPRFPSLRELMPIDVSDDGYRHIGMCERLEALILMYCRETTDAATQHITGLTSLKKYFASYTRITDRTPQLLSGMPSLEEIEFDSCAGLTNAGLAALARLPRLRELRVSGMAGVTREVTDAFSPHVRVTHAV